MDAVSIRLGPISELMGELKRIYKEETGIRHLDLVLSKKPF